jgi:integrase
MLKDAHIQKAIRAGTNTQLSDGSGRGTGRLVLIIRNSSAVWYAQQWLNGRKRMRKLGRYPALSLAQARDRFESDFSETIAIRSDIRIATDAQPGTLRDLLDGYIGHLTRQGKHRAAKETGYAFARVLAHMDERMLARDVQPQHIVNVLRPIHQSGAASMADHLRGYISAAFTWGLKNENDYRTDKPRTFRLSTNPCAPIPVAEKVAGNRFLSVQELRTFWYWLHERECHARTVLRMMILTGQRIEMLCEIRADMFDGECVFWPTTKTGKPHLLPLPRQAVYILRSTEPNEHGWFFPRLFLPERPLGDDRVLDVVRRYRRTGVEHFVPRDIRRTWKTLAGKAGLTKVERDLIQCHSIGDVSSRHYDRYEYVNEKRQAMERWSDWFAAQIEV